MLPIQIVQTSGGFPSLPSPPSLAPFASSPPFCFSGEADGDPENGTESPSDDEVPVYVCYKI
jgi:hypothetical protein